MARPEAAGQGARQRMPRHRDRELLRQVGARLKEIRQRSRWTQEALAEAAGVEPVTLSRYETGDRPLSISTLARIASAVRVPLAELLALERELPRAPSDPKEAELVRVWRRLDAERRDLALRIVREIGRARRRTG